MTAAILPQETKYEKIVEVHESPKPPPIYRYVDIEVKGKPTIMYSDGVARTARPTTADYQGTVLKTEQRVLSPKKTSVKTDDRQFQGQTL